MRTSNLSLLNYLEYTILNRSMGYTYMKCTYRVRSMDVQGTRVSARVYLESSEDSNGLIPLGKEKEVGI